MTMSKEEQSIELVNPEINKIKVGVGIGIILFSFTIQFLNVAFSEYIQPVEIIFRFGTFFLCGFGGVLIGLGLRLQWFKKRE